jgi:transcription termination/antitermination protein NusG
MKTMPDSTPVPDGTAIQEPSRRWYAIQVFTGQEEKVKRYVLEEAERLGLGDQITDVHIPTEKKVEMRGGKRKVKDVINFPGYMFVEMVLTLKSRHFLLNSPSVLNFVGPNNEPHPLSDVDVKRIIGRMGSADEPTLDHRFKVAEMVKIIDGPFNDFTGSVQEINEERKRLKVMVSIFGRSTPVDLSFAQVEPID